MPLSSNTQTLSSDMGTGLSVLAGLVGLRSSESYSGGSAPLRTARPSRSQHGTDRGQSHRSRSRSYDPPPQHRTAARKDAHRQSNLSISTENMAYNKANHAVQDPRKAQGIYNWMQGHSADGLQDDLRSTVHSDAHNDYDEHTAPPSTVHSAPADPSVAFKKFEWHRSAPSVHSVPLRIMPPGSVASTSHSKRSARPEQKLLTWHDDTHSSSFFTPQNPMNSGRLTLANVAAVSGSAKSRSRSSRAAPTVMTLSDCESDALTSVSRSNRRGASASGVKSTRSRTRMSHSVVPSNVSNQLCPSTVFYDAESESSGSASMSGSARGSRRGGSRPSTPATSVSSGRSYAHRNAPPALGAALSGTEHPELQVGVEIRKLSGDSRSGTSFADNARRRRAERKRANPRPLAAIR